MKKLIISIFAIIALLGANTSSVFAAGWNDDPQDLNTVMVSNHTTNPCNTGPGVGCWSSSISNVSAGDIVSVQIYFHNTSNTPANNVSLFMGPQSTGSTTSQTFAGGVKVNGTIVAAGSGTVNLNSSQTLTFISGSVLLKKTQGSSEQVILNENDLFNGGVSIGSVGTGWANQGVLRARFQVSNNGGGGGGETCYINSFTANGSSYTTINQGNNATLAWDTTGCTSANISSIGSVALDNFGYSVTPGYTTTYTLTAYGTNGTPRTSQVTVNVSTNNQNYCDATLSADQYTINQGNSTYIRWVTNGLSSVQIYPNIGSQGASGSAYVAPQQSTTYTLTGYGCGGTYTRTVTVTVNTVVNPPILPTAPQAITTVPIVLGNTQARLNGIGVPNISYGTTTAWFEWGTTGSLGARTNTQTLPANSTSNYYMDTLSGLVPGQVYYYRAVVQNQNGTAYGDLQRFQTTRTTVVTPPRVIVSPVTTTTVVAQSAPSLLELRVQSNYDTMCVGGSLDYTITYRNVSAQTLQGAVLRFVLPKEVTLINASRGDYDVVDRTLTVVLGSIAPGEQGIVTVRATINDTAVRGNLTVTTATVVYTNTVTRAQEDAIAYSLITIADTCPTNVLGASTFGFGNFLPQTLLGWLLLILVILALIVIGRNLYKKTLPPQA